MSERRNWSDQEVVEAIALYLVTEFGKIHSGNPQIIALSEKLNRSPNAIALKLANLAALDESLPRKGLANVSKTDRRMWELFESDPSRVLAAYNLQSAQSVQTVESAGIADRHNFVFEEVQSKFAVDQPTERTINTNARIGQSFFREMILVSYRRSCALTGIEDSRLLNASHISAWKDDMDNRLNPRNGICLNALHDRAFDRHLITFDENYRLIVSPCVPEIARRELAQVESNQLKLPDRFLPDQNLLECHRQKFSEQIAVSR